MSNATALVLVLAIGGILLLDSLVLGLGVPLFLARRGLDLIGWLAVWR